PRYERCFLASMIFRMSSYSLYLAQTASKLRTDMGRQPGPCFQRKWGTWRSTVGPAERGGSETNVSSMKCTTSVSCRVGGNQACWRGRSRRDARFLPRPGSDQPVDALACLPSDPVLAR